MTLDFDVTFSAHALSVIDIAARTAIVVFVFLLSIAINRRKQIFTVKNATGPTQLEAIQLFAQRSLRDVNILIYLCAVGLAIALAYCLYSIFAAS